MTKLARLSSDSSRLPSYRSSHVGRFHPYPTVSRPIFDDPLMRTVDYRDALEPVVEEPEPVIVVSHCYPIFDAFSEAPDADVSTLELDYPVVGDEQFFGGAHEKIGRKIAVAVVFIDMMAAMRTRYLTLLAAMKYKEPQEKES